MNLNNINANFCNLCYIWATVEIEVVVIDSGRVCDYNKYIGKQKSK